MIDFRLWQKYHSLFLFNTMAKKKEVDYKRAWNSVTYLNNMYSRTKKSIYFDLAILYKMAIDWYDMDNANTEGGKKFDEQCYLNNIEAEFYTPWRI